MSLQYGELRPLAAEIVSLVWSTPANFNGFRVSLRYCSDVAQRKPTKLCTTFGRVLAWYNIYTFSGVLPRNGILQVQHSVCVQVLRSPILAALSSSSSSTIFLTWP